MKIVDANVLLYAANRAAAQHKSAERWLTAALSGTEAIALPWVCLLAFIRISTNPRITPRPLTTQQAFTLVESWLSRPVAVIPEPTARHLSILKGLLDMAGTAGNLTTDAHLAALATEHGATIATFDRDFERFGVSILIPG